MPGRKESLPTMKNTAVVVLDGEDDADSGLHFGEGRRSSHKTADFEAGFKNACATPKEWFADSKTQVNKGRVQHPTRNLGLV